MSAELMERLKVLLDDVRTAAAGMEFESGSGRSDDGPQRDLDAALNSIGSLFLEVLSSANKRTDGAA